MQKIQILDSRIHNRIAAGEVVEAPFCVVKELVENSIDAGATSITVEIKKGGIDYVCVSDNGHGIEKDQVKLAFMRYATSKIQKIEDLDAIASLGFRGEALSSIAAVASVKIISRVAHEELGYTVHFDTGVLMDEGEIGASVGTTTKVENLFLNIPARRKFLRSIGTEKTEINKLMTKLILANPNIAIKYIADEKIIHQSNGLGVEAALTAIYDTETEYFFPIDKSAPGIKISGFISRPENSKPNKNHQTVIVNGRYVECSDISYAVLAALKNYLMHRRYPAYLIYINIPYDMLDINVHPQKTEVKFIDQKRIISLIYQAISSNMKAMFSSVSDIFNDKQFPQSDIDLSQIKDFSLDSINTSARDSFVQDINFSNLVMSEKSTRLDFSPNWSSASKPARTAAAVFERSSFYNQDGIRMDDDFSFIKQLGVIFNTYILIEKEDALYLIDQHAAHERLLYNKFKAEIEDKSAISQPLLVPYSFNEDINYSINALKELGFDIKEGKIFAVPFALYHIELAVFVHELTKENNINQITVLDFIKEKIIQSACKAAVKSGDRLSSADIDALLKEMSKEKELCCPHGRPLIVKLTRREIDRLFKRL